MASKKPGAKKPKTASHKGPVEGYMRLQELGSERLGAVEAALLKDESLLKIARRIQDEWKSCLDTKLTTLQKQLQRYRDNVLLPRAAHAQQKMLEGKLGNAKEITAGVKRLNVMDLLEEFVTLQRERIQKAYLREKTLPVVTETVTKLFKDYNHSLGKLADLQMETGYLRRAPRVVQGQFGFGGGEDAGQKPQFEVEFEIHQQQRSALATIADITRDAIEGEYELVESGRSVLPDSPTRAD